MTLTALALATALAMGTASDQAETRSPVNELADSGLTLSGPWSIGPRLELARAGLSVASLDGRIYAAGGAGLVDPRDDFEVYDPADGVWRALKPLPVGLERFAMASLDGRLFVAGGYSSEESSTPIDKVWSYDAQTDVWSAETDLPDAKASFVMVGLEGRLYALGGEDGGSGLFIYEAATQAWNAAEAPVEVNRRGSAAVVLGQAIWLIGGARLGEATSRVDIYDTVSGVWSRGPDLPEPRAGHGAAIVNGTIHVFGGRSADMRQTLASHLSLSTQQARWTVEAEMPAARTEAGVAAMNDQVWLVGGGAGAGFFAPFTAIDAVDIFSPGAR